MRHPARRSLLLAAGLALALSAAADPADAQGNHSCEGLDACVGNTGKVAEDAGNGRRAWAVNTGNIASNSCNGVRAPTAVRTSPSAPAMAKAPAI